MQALKMNITEPGLYFYPGMDMSADLSKEQQAVWEAKYKAGPVGLILFDPEGGDVMPPSQLITELVTNVIAAVFVGLILVNIGGTFRKRVAVVGLIGVIGWVSISLSYWNWYRFPTPFILAEGLDQVIGWTLVGIVLAKMTRVQQS